MKNDQRIWYALDAQSVYSNFCFSLTCRVLWIKQPHPRYPLLLIYRNHLSQSIWFSWIWASLSLEFRVQCLHSTCPCLTLSPSMALDLHWITCGACSTCRLSAFTQTHCLILLEWDPMSTHRGSQAEICCLDKSIFTLSVWPTSSKRSLPQAGPGWACPPSNCEIVCVFVHSSPRWASCHSCPLADGSPLLTGLVSHLQLDSSHWKLTVDSK